MSGAAKPPAGQVGYRRPPEQHRFKKGQSGNPKGRPAKGSRAGAPAAGALTDLDTILLKEALRPIQIRENDRVVELPMIQAVLRSLGVAAVKGHHRSQLALAGMVKAVQAAQNEHLAELFTQALHYKEDWLAEIRRCQQLGLPVPDPVPHPEDMVLDEHTLQIRFNGPQSPDEKRQWDHMLERRAEALQEVADFRARARRSKKSRAFFEDEARYEQRIADIIGAVIPDEKTRRRPGFDLKRWRDGSPLLNELQTQRATKRKRAGSSSHHRTQGS